MLLVENTESRFICQDMQLYAFCDITVLKLDGKNIRLDCKHIIKQILLIDFEHNLSNGILHHFIYVTSWTMWNGLKVNREL